jgi:hypothetical protein
LQGEEKAMITEVAKNWDELTKPQNLPRLRAILKPSVLEAMNKADMEILLSLLPKYGPLRGRTPGALRVMSIGYHAHIVGTAIGSPYEVDYVTRLHSCSATSSIILRIPEKCGFRGFGDVPMGKNLHFLKALSLAEEKKLFSVGELELLLQKIFRPGTPNSWQWGTPGGVHEPKGPDAVEQGVVELTEEAEGLTLIASDVLLHNQIFQSGNIPEWHTIVVMLCSGSPVVTDGARYEGIVEYKSVRLAQAISEITNFEREGDINSPNYIPFDGKILQGLMMIDRWTRVMI